MKSFGWLLLIQLACLAVGSMCLGFFIAKIHYKCERPAAWHYDLAPHEQQPEPQLALAPGRWIDERYQL